jgi:hypothetical protein
MKTQPLSRGIQNDGTIIWFDVDVSDLVELRPWGKTAIRGWHGHTWAVRIQTSSAELQGRSEQATQNAERPVRFRAQQYTLTCVRAQ